MTLVSSPGFVAPSYPWVSLNMSFTSMALTASGYKVSFVGQVWFPGAVGQTKNISKVGFRFGTITKSGTTALTVSLQDVDAATGGPFRPDGTQDQTVAVANASIVANTWLQTNALSANRTVSFGEPLAVVVEFSTFNASDSIGISSIADAVANGITPHFAGAVLYNNSTWARQSVQNGILLEFDDGTFGTLGTPHMSYSSPCSAIGTQSLNTGTTPDEAGLRFTLPFECRIDGGWFLTNPSATADFDLVLYEGTTQRSAISVDATRIVTAALRDGWAYFATPPIVKPNTEYTLAIKPTTANSISLQYFDVSANGHFDAYAGGRSWYWNQRTDAGSWTPTTTRRPYMGLFVNQVHGSVANNPESILGW